MSLRFLALAVLVVLPLAARADETAAPSSAHEIHAAGAVKAARQTVLSQLKDPASAKFGDIHAFTAPGKTFACGHVNAKNSFGGYTGMQPFYVLIFAKHLPNGKNVYVGAIADVANITNKYEAQVWSDTYPKCSVY